VTKEGKKILQKIWIFVVLKSTESLGQRSGSVVRGAYPLMLYFHFSGKYGCPKNGRGFHVPRKNGSVVFSRLQKKWGCDAFTFSENMGVFSNWMPLLTKS
jgi:hypothetical protein